MRQKVVQDWDWGCGTEVLRTSETNGKEAAVHLQWQVNARSWQEVDADAETEIQRGSSSTSCHKTQKQE